MKSALNLLFSINNERHKSSATSKATSSSSIISSIFTGNKQIFSRTFKTNTPNLLLPPNSRKMDVDIIMADTPATSASTTTFFGLPSVSHLMRATQTVASLALGRNPKRPYEPEDPSLKIIPSESAANPRATKRRRTDSDYSSESESSSPPRAIPYHSISNPPTSGPPSSALLPPDAHRIGLEPQSIGLWISELLNDRFSASHRVSEDDSFLDESSMKTLCDLLIEVMEVLNPSNNTIFAGLIYFERLMRSISLRCSDCQTERFDLAKRTFLVSLNLAFVWLDDAPWTLSAIAEWMDLSLCEAKKWEIEALVVLEYHLAISTNMWLYWLDALQAHADDINFQPNVAEAISNVFYNAREDVLETELAKERFF
ncbi:hypothetical protein PQX77_022102, partial [Marasmius sp. AFHP31]